MKVNGGAVTSLSEWRSVSLDMKTTLTTTPAWTELLDAYTAWLLAAGRPSTTVKLRNYHLRRFAAETNVAALEATLEQLLEYLADHKWGANTRRSMRSSLRSFYIWAHTTGRMRANPAALLPTVHVLPGSPRPASEVAIRFGMAGTSERVQLMIQLGAFMGLRCCEIAVVAREDVREDLLGYSLLVHGKGGKQRVVAIPAPLVHVLVDGEAGFMFPGQIDGHLSASYVSKLISRALPAGATAHPLRHRFAAVAYKATGNDIRAVQELLGHASVATTQIYTPVEQDSLRRAVEAAAA